VVVGPTAPKGYEEPLLLQPTINATGSKAVIIKAINIIFNFVFPFKFNS
jgi:uncharacterized membrane protein